MLGRVVAQIYLRYLGHHHHHHHQVRVTDGTAKAIQVLQDHQARGKSRPKLHGYGQRESGDCIDSMWLEIPQTPL